MRQHGLTILTGLTGVALLAGCTTTSPGRPEPPPSTASTETTTPANRSTGLPSGELLPSDGAPKVRNPLDVSRFQQNPCLALTASQAQELNLPPQGTPGEETLGKACRWRNPETRGEVELRFNDQNQRGLSAAYRANNQGLFAYFVELPPIEEFPAVAADRTDDRKNGTCPVDVGVSDAVSFVVFIQLSRANVGQKDPCEVNPQVAGMLLRTMKAGG